MKGRQPYICGLGPVFDAIAGKWKVLLLWELNPGRLRFGELRRRVAGITEKGADPAAQGAGARRPGAARGALRDAAAGGVFLTELGVTLNDALIPLAEWGKRYQRAKENTRV
ncbi:HxlR family transcriptional regulator [Saccharopolyspora erythraea NRRL 2338]|uniref:Transcriptional regulator n=2 Tax=Saccharopolyspora erythraea TaxID=1836 RepID=A4FP10_SACEN|nr:helix-turn-helix domain-containing protein [Saccharopolyspora erythraea]PFG99427.1 HxlR family transcriptional regulator [Saccharopolyspora erythraea NRRL 2338]QRK89337.1 helix-turn-helix transcriptional regulator [Saccharopolyspora erythraea]CAM05785.1 transcriptional regulator [Saccharopolyspora erythraea NRRL 2338]